MRKISHKIATLWHRSIISTSDTIIFNWLKIVSILYIFCTFRLFFIRNWWKRERTVHLSTFRDTSSLHYTRPQKRKDGTFCTFLLEGRRKKEKGRYFFIRGKEEKRERTLHFGTFLLEGRRKKRKNGTSQYVSWYILPALY